MGGRISSWDAIKVAVCEVMRPFFTDSLFEAESLTSLAVCPVRHGFLMGK
jgi:hypothetical protein